MKVPPEGPLDAALYLVGEAPGKEEDLKGKPFIGGAGKILSALLLDAGIPRGLCRLGNLSQIRPRGNKFSNLEPVQLAKDIALLKADIREVAPRVVVALGNEPLYHLTGNKQIGHWRGSIIWSEELSCKIIPTYHPSFIQRGQWKLGPLVQFDLERAFADSKHSRMDHPPYSFYLQPPLHLVNGCLDSIERSGRFAFDIETLYGTPYMTAIALAWRTPADVIASICIPFTKGPVDYWTFDDEYRILDRIKRLLGNRDIKKIAQNAQFDIAVLQEYYGIQTLGLEIDTMCAFHCLYPEFPKGLDTICSLYTRQPYYKHWVKGDFWKYNATDAAVTLDAGEQMVVELEEGGIGEYYHGRINPLIGQLIEMQLKGVRVDVEKREALAKEYRVRLNDLEARLNKIVGHDFNVGSTKDLKELLYNRMGLPVKYHSKSGAETTNEEALRELSLAHPSPLFDLILAIRRIRKLLSTYLEAPLTRERVHTSYNIGGRVVDQDTGRVVSGPTSMRLSSSYSIVMKSGTNLQNIPHGDMRRVFLPDPGMVFVSVDLSQAESRVVAWLAKETLLIEAYLAGEDIHQMNADLLPPDFMPPGESYKEMKNPRRYFTKKHVHAFNYGESAWGFAKLSGVSRSLAKEIRDRYFRRYSQIEVWHQVIRRQLGNNRILETPFGWKREFFGKLDEALIRSAYSFNPQNTVAVVLNTAMMRITEATRGWADMLMQVHDQVILQTQPEEVERLSVEVFPEAFNIPIPLPVGELIIPYDVKTGKNWEDLHEYE